MKRLDSVRRGILIVGMDADIPCTETVTLVRNLRDGRDITLTYEVVLEHDRQGLSSSEMADAIRLHYRRQCAHADKSCGCMNGGALAVAVGKHETNLKVQYSRRSS